MQLDHVRAIVTGAASGLGFGLARQLIDRGAKVALFDVHAENGARAVAELGAEARYFDTDVSNEDQVAQNVKAAHDWLGGVNVAVNCAGVLAPGKVLGKDGPMPLKLFHSAVLVNLVGSFNVAKAAADLMQHNMPREDGERGVIINTASVAAYEGQIGQAAYSASKGGVVGMTLPMAREFARIGIRVMTIAPGSMHTPMLSSLPQPVYDAISAQVPFPSRLGTAEEFADAVLFIVQNRYMNGSVMRLDGAIRLAPK